MEMNLEVDLDHYRPLYLAALEGKWEDASRFFENNPNAFTAKISISSMTALHAAASNGQTEFVKKMLQDKRLPSEVLAMPDKDGLTPLHYAAMAGNFRMAKALLTTDSSLTQIADYSGFTPLLTACAVAPECEELVEYLARNTKDDPPASPFTGNMAGLLISSLVYAGLYDIVQYLLDLYPDLTTADSAVSHVTILLRAMAEAPSTFESGRPFGIWERLIYQIVPAEPIDTVSRSLKGDVEEPSQNSKSHAETSVWRRTYAPQVLRWLMSPAWEWEVIKSVRKTKSRHKLAMDLVETVCKQISKMSTVEILMCFNDHDILDTAVMNGVVEIVRVCLKYFPDSIDQTLMVYAVKHRQEKIFNLLSERTTLSKRRALSDMVSFLKQDSSQEETWLKALSNTETDNVLIRAAKLSPQPRLTGVFGAAFQMQREMQWFKAVENMNPSFKARKFGQKPAWHTFQEEHKDLLKEGREWMRNTSNSCMLVATLIATVVFAAAFTVPGGYVEGTDNQNMAGLAPAPAPAGGNASDAGIPIFLKKPSFYTFAVSDALALFSSITSILMFLSILTSRYAEEDFLKSLPRKLMIGIISLLVAIGAMMIAFGAAFYITLGMARESGLKQQKQRHAVFILIVFLSLVPVILFGTLQLRLFIQMVPSLFGKSPLSSTKKKTFEKGIFRPQKSW